jgi:hypothetical protein
MQQKTVTTVEHYDKQQQVVNEVENAIKEGWKIVSVGVSSSYAPSGGVWVVQTYLLEKSETPKNAGEFIKNAAGS